MNSNPFSLEGKTILVTGASSGIGKATAIQCSQMGATMIVTGRDEGRLAETLAALHGSGHTAIAADLAAEEGLDLLIGSLPRLDGMVLAAGISELWPVSFATRDRVDKIFNTNLHSPMETIRRVVKKKLFNPGFSIVAIDSIAGSSDFCPANSIYGAGKAALKAFIKYVAVEMAPKKIRANTISPGMILTPLQRNGVLDDAQLEQTIAKVPLKRWGEPEDVACCAVYLLSDAASYVTGADICVDGGYTI